MMPVKKPTFPRTGDDDILKISKVIKNCMMKMQDEIKDEIRSKDKVIN